MGIMDGKTVFITGGTRGVGFALATRALEEGAQAVAICGSKEETVAPALAKLKEAFPAKAEEIFGYWPNLRVEAEIARDMNDFVAKVGRLDVCCSNAGITHNTTIKRIPEGDFQNQVDINLTATYYVDRQAGLIMMKQRSGSIVNTASMTGLYGSGMGCGYGASKAGVIGLTRSLGRELAFFNIRVNCVAPGVIDTDMVAGLSPEAVKAVSAGIALRRMAKPEEVANAILFLGSDLASYCTATCLSVDGWTT